MSKMYEVNGNKSKYPLDLPLCKEDGSLQEFFLVSGESRKQITLSQFVNGQISIITSDCEDASGGDNSRGNYEQNVSSGDYVHNASSGYNAQNASSGNYAQNASSGHSARNASSGRSARNASSGHYAKNASSGDYAKNASSGRSAQNASSGHSARNASSGDSAQNASSGDFAQNASSGDFAQNASSGHYAKNASSGDNTQNASSGYKAQNITTGKNSIDFHCGRKSTIKAVNGTWISLAEYEKVENIWIPCFALSAQIGNSDYIDADGNTLSEDETYILYNRKFCKTIRADGILLIKKNEKKVGELTVWMTEEPYNTESELKYLIFDGENYSHGKTAKEAKESLIYKISNRDTSTYECWIGNPEFIISKGDAIKGYRAITGACEAGTRSFVDNFGAVPENLTIRELCDITKGQWGHDELVKFLGSCED